MLHLQFVNLNIKSNIALIQLNRPKSLNSINFQLIYELNQSINYIKTQHIKTLIFTGSFKSFCSGADLKERITLSNKNILLFLNKLNNLLNKIENLDFITIAAINGIAFGGGLELALACDFIVMNNKSTIGLTESSLGIIPGAGGTQRLSRKVGINISKYLIFSAKKLTADDALNIKLIYSISNSYKETLIQAYKLAYNLSLSSNLSISYGKKAIIHGYSENIYSGLKFEKKYYKKLFFSQDRINGLISFQNKYPQKFGGF